MSKSKERIENKVLCSIYRSQRKEGAYLYTKATSNKDSFSEVPEPLQKELGKLTEVMKLMLDETRSLANADTKTVIANIQEQGFYLQLPPTKRFMQQRNETEL